MRSATILFVSATVYALAWVPDLARHSPDQGEIHTVNDVVYRQYTMYEYHHNLVATHPYSSKWWEWPIDYVPIAYYYQDHRKDTNDPRACCCIYEITSLPNPVVLWFGLFAVSFVAVLALRERNKAYSLIVITYLLQWLPWVAIAAPHVRLPFLRKHSAHLSLQRRSCCSAFWQWGSGGKRRTLAGGPRGIGAYVAAAAGAFVYFYPVLAAHPIAWNAWHARMWFPTWVIGPG